MTGRNRHLLVATLGLLLGGVVPAANGDDGAGAKRVLADARRRDITQENVWADQTYRGDLAAWLRQEGYPTTLESSSGPQDRRAFRCCPAAGWLNARWPG